MRSARKSAAANPDRPRVPAEHVDAGLSSRTVKLTVLWILSGVWAAVLVYTAWTYFKLGVRSDVGFLERPEHLFTGVGALTVGGIPLFLTWLVHRYQKKRLRGRLLRDSERIQRQLARLDEREADAARPTGS